MKKLLFLQTLLFLLASTAFAANFYVKPSAAGGGTGADWNNAWAIADINWGAVKSGDIVWLAGGSYPGLNIGTKGAQVLKATSNDPSATGAAGWSTAFDAQVVFSSNGGAIVALNGGTLDGHKWAPPGLPTQYGILINLPASPNSSTNNKGVDGNNGGTLRNVDIAGPGYCVTKFETDGMYVGANTLVSGCRIHDTDELIHSYPGVSNSTVEYTYLYNAASNIVNSGNSQDPHPDAWYSGGGTTNTTVRYCVMANIVSEANFYDNQGAGSNMVYYGNVFWQGDTVPAGCVPIEFQNGAAYGTVNIINNTFVDWSKGNYTGPGTTVGSGSKIANNIFYNCTVWSGFGTNSNPSSNPFVSYKASTQENVPTGYDPAPFVAGFAPKANVPGTDMGAPYNVDMNGKSLGSNAGALAVSGTAGPTPTATPSPKPTATPTATPKPTATPTPTPVAGNIPVGSSVTPIDTANVRQTPAGTPILGTQAPGQVGVVAAGPQTGTLPGSTPIPWYDCIFNTGASGWVGGNNLTVVKAVPTPTPSPTPIPSYHTWEAKLNAEMATGVSASQLMSWITANPPAAD
jgi:hypothetical protein